MQQLTTTHNGLIPSNQESLARQLLGILREAQKKNGLSEDNDGKFVDYPPDVQARVAQDMLEIASRKQDELKVSQAFIVAYVARNELWRFTEHADLRDFLKNAELSSQTTSILHGFGDTVVPYCDAHDIELHNVMGADEWPKLKDALPALKRATRDDDPEMVREILGDVSRATSRDAIRDKYSRSRHESMGHAATYILSNGQPVLIALLNDTDASGQLVGLLDGRLTWDLIFYCTEKGLVFECPNP